MTKKLKSILVVIPLVLFSFVMSSYVDSYFEISKNLDIFITLFKELNLYYVDDTEPGDLVEKGIDGMLKSLDPYTTFIPESDIEDYRFMTTGQYGGIGALIRKKDSLVVVAEPYEGFPADKAGLIAGDIILEVNGKSTEGKSTSDISEVLKGQPQTESHLGWWQMAAKSGHQGAKDGLKTTVNAALRQSNVQHKMSFKVGFDSFLAACAGMSPKWS